MSDHSLESCHPLLQELRSHAFSVWSQREPLNSGEAGEPYLGERRRDAAPLSLREALKRPLLSQAGSRPPSYLIPFHFRIYELAGMQECTHGCGQQECERKPLPIRAAHVAPVKAPHFLL